jgi:DNA-binding transcriptional LysR family regulator
MIDLRRLRVLHELQARGTVTAVAHALSFTPSAVSQQLAKLERETGVALLERIGRGVRLTDAGLALAAHAERILASVDAAEADLAVHDGAVRGRLRIGTFQSAGLALLVPAIDALGRDYPALEIEVVEADPEETLPALLLGELDLVFADDYEPTPLAHPSLDRETLLEDELRIALARDDALVTSGDVQVSDLADRAWAMGQAGSSYAAAVERLCKERGAFTPRISHRASDLLLLLSIVRTGRAVAMLPDILGAEHDDRIAVRSIAEGKLTRTIYTAVRSGSSRRPTVVVLRRVLKEVARRAPRVLASETTLA